MKKLVLMVCAFLVFASVLLANSPQFLWKPVSESNGKLVVLFPYQVRLESVQSISINDKFKPSRVTQDGANGDRIHARFDKPGKDYGNNAVVKVTLKSGKELTWTVPRGKDRYENISNMKPTGSGGNSTFGDLLDAEAPKGAVRLTNANQGTEEYEVKADGEITVDCVLSTYGPAEMWIKDEAEAILLSWSRSSDKDPAKLTVQGKEIEGSNPEVAPGDFTPTAQKVKIEVKAGQKLKAHLSGEFGNAQSYLVINE
ncbi:MAG: hypothetical protein AB1403_12100 [Candidatus Riflebacteria bacterium]